MQGILADVNIQGHVDFLVALMQSDSWKSLWDELNVQYLSFAQVGLDASAKDSAIWHLCQDRGYVLITSNRNQSGADSLEATLRQRTKLDSFPVLTMSAPERFHHDRAYVEKVVERVFDILLDLDAYRGAGRLYLP